MPSLSLPSLPPRMCAVRLSLCLHCVVLRQDYNKSHSVTAMKANPLGGSSMAKGIVLEKM